MFRSTKDLKTFEGMTNASKYILEYLEQDEAFKRYRPGFRHAQVSLWGRRVQARFSYIAIGGWGTQGHDEYALVIQAIKKADGWLLSHRHEVCKVDNAVGRSGRRVRLT